MTGSHKALQSPKRQGSPFTFNDRTRPVPPPNSTGLCVFDAFGDLDVWMAERHRHNLVDGIDTGDIFDIETVRLDIKIQPLRGFEEAHQNASETFDFHCEIRGPAERKRKVRTRQFGEHAVSDNRSTNWHELHTARDGAPRTIVERNDRSLASGMQASWIHSPRICRRPARLGALGSASDGGHVSGSTGGVRWRGPAPPVARAPSAQQLSRSALPHPPAVDAGRSPPLRHDLRGLSLPFSSARLHHRLPEEHHFPWHSPPPC